jgi:selenocysteine lyase/cysteine desulfurase
VSIDRRAFVATAASLAASAAIRPGAALTLPTAAAERRDDPLGVRADFPVLAGRVFLNSAHIAPVPRQVAAAGRDFVDIKLTRPLEIDELLAKADAVRAQFAALVNATPEEIGLLFSTGEGENVVANGIGLTQGDNVVIDELHFPTEFVLYRALEASRGIELRIVKHRDGAVTASDYESHVDQRTRLVSVAWVSHLNGFRHDVRPIADLAHAHGALFYVDAIQAVGMFPVDVRAAGVDFLCCGTYKWLLAGFGVAPFFIRRELIDRIRPDRFGWGDIARELPDYRYQLEATAKRFDYSCRAFGAIYQLGASLSYLASVGIPRIEQHSVSLAQRLHAGLDRQGYKLFTPPDNRSSIVVAFTSKPMTDIQATLQKANLHVTAEDGHIRIAPALFNTTDDVDRCLEVTPRLV